MARMPSTRFLEPLRSMLSDSFLRDAARQALVRIGPPALDFLARSLADQALARSIRIHLPRTISRFAPRDAMPVLWRRLPAEADEAIQFKILRGLGRLVAQDAAVRPSAAEIVAVVREMSRAGLRFTCWHARLSKESRAQPGCSSTGPLLLQFLADKRFRTTESIFRLLGLHHPGEDFERVFRGLRGSRIDRASGRELVEHVVPA